MGQSTSLVVRTNPANRGPFPLTVSIDGLAWPQLAGYPASMPEVTGKQIEAEARRILREKIKRMPWHEGCSREERRRRIEADVDRWWHLEVEEATRRLLDKLR